MILIIKALKWIDCHDVEQSIISYRRKKYLWELIIILNFTPVPRNNYRLGVPDAGTYTEILIPTPNIMMAATQVMAQWYQSLRSGWTILTPLALICRFGSVDLKVISDHRIIYEKKYSLLPVKHNPLIENGGLADVCGSLPKALVWIIQGSAKTDHTELSGVWKPAKVSVSLFLLRVLITGISISGNPHAWQSRYRLVGWLSGLF